MTPKVTPWGKGGSEGGGGGWKRFHHVRPRRDGGIHPFLIPTTKEPRRDRLKETLCGECRANALFIAWISVSLRLFCAPVCRVPSLSRVYREKRNLLTPISQTSLLLSRLALCFLWDGMRATDDSHMDVLPKFISWVPFFVK